MKRRAKWAVNGVRKWLSMVVGIQSKTFGAKFQSEQVIDFFFWFKQFVAGGTFVVFH